MAADPVNVAAAAEAVVKVDTSNALCYGASRTLAVFIVTSDRNWFLEPGPPSQALLRKE
jgi:hypothetical protein